MTKARILTILLLCIILSFSLCFVISAEETEDNTYYVVTSEDSSVATTLISEGKKIVAVSDLYETMANAQDSSSGYFFYNFEGKTLNLILAENVSYVHPDITKDWDTAGIRLEMAITVNVYFNGYYWWIPSDTHYAGFVVNNEGASLNFIGKRTHEQIMAGLDMSQISASNTTSSVDFYGGYVGIYMGKGHLSIKDAVIAGRDELIYQKDGACGYIEVELDNIAAFVSNNLYTLCFKPKGKAKNILKIEGSNLGRVYTDNSYEGSYIKNSTLGALDLDTYLGRNEYEILVESCTILGSYTSFGDSFILIAKNTIFNTVSLSGDSSGGAHAVFYDCTYNSLSFNSANGQLTKYTSATCTENGTKVVISNDGIPVPDDTYSDPAKGHSIVGEELRRTYESLLEKGTAYYACERCGEATKECSAIFVSLGYSVNQSGALLQGFAVNRQALEAYGKEVKFGLVVANAEKVTTTDIVTSEGEANTTAGKVITADFTQLDYVIFEMKIKGLVTDEYKALSLYCQGYYIIDGTVYYMNDGEASDTPTSTTFNEQSSLLGA